MVLGPRMVEVGQVAAVVDDALGVGVGEPDPRQRRVAKRRAPVGEAAELEGIASLALSSGSGRRARRAGRPSRLRRAPRG